MINYPFPIGTNGIPRRQINERTERTILDE
jgi:hypothetical protein